MGSFCCDDNYLRQNRDILLRSMLGSTGLAEGPTGALCAHAFAM